MSPTPSSPLRILLVEDAVGMRKIVASLLLMLGYDDVATAADGRQALQLLQGQPFDLVLTNWNMPVMDGLQLIKQIPGSPKHARIPVILFTSRASRKDVVEALDVGVDGYLAKPFTASQLQEQLQGVLERRTQRRVTQIVEGLDPLRREGDHALMLAGDAAASSQLMQPEGDSGILSRRLKMLDSESKRSQSRPHSPVAASRLPVWLASTSDPT